MNESNLVPNSARTPKERRENARKAGKASGKARKERSTLRAAFRTLLEAKSASADDPRKQLTGAEQIALAVSRQAQQGNIKACKLIAEITGEYKQEIAIEAKADIKAQRELSPQKARERLKEIEAEI